MHYRQNGQYRTEKILFREGSPSKDRFHILRENSVAEVTLFCFLLRG